MGLNGYIYDLILVMILFWSLICISRVLCTQFWHDSLEMNKTSTTRSSITTIVVSLSESKFIKVDYINHGKEKNEDRKKAGFYIQMYCS